MAYFHTPFLQRLVDHPLPALRQAGLVSAVGYDTYMHRMMARSRSPTTVDTSIFPSSAVASSEDSRRTAALIANIARQMSRGPGQATQRQLQVAASSDQLD